MIGIDVIGMFPVRGRDGGIGGGADAVGLGADDEVFAVGFVPDGDDVDAASGGEAAGSSWALAW